MLQAQQQYTLDLPYRVMAVHSSGQVVRLGMFLTNEQGLAPERVMVENLDTGTTEFDQVDGISARKPVFRNDQKARSYR